MIEELMKTQTFISIRKKHANKRTVEMKKVESCIREDNKKQEQCEACLEKKCVEKSISNCCKRIQDL